VVRQIQCRPLQAAPEEELERFGGGRARAGKTFDVGIKLDQQSARLCHRLCSRISIDFDKDVLLVSGTRSRHLIVVENFGMILENSS
jgi:hypothetical protein